MCKPAENGFRSARLLFSCPPFAMKIYIDGSFYSQADAKVSVFDHGLLYGDGIFEGIRFYKEVFDAEVIRKNDIIAELQVAGAIIGIHSGGEGQKTWTGMSFQVADLFEASRLVKAAGGTVTKEPEDTPEEPAHLAMCVDPEGNEIMLTKARQGR